MRGHRRHRRRLAPARTRVESVFTTETSRSCSSISCTEKVSSFSRRPRIVRPSRGHGSDRPVDRQHRAGRIEQRALQRRRRARRRRCRSGRARCAGPCRSRGGRWRSRPCPSKSVRPRSTWPTFTAVPPTSKPARMNATRPSISDGCSLKPGMPASGRPIAMTRARSSSDTERRNCPRRRSAPATASPLRAVAQRALARVEPRAGLDVHRAVLARMVLRGALRAPCAASRPSPQASEISAQESRCASQSKHTHAEGCT